MKFLVGLLLLIFERESVIFFDSLTVNWLIVTSKVGIGINVIFVELNVYDEFRPSTTLIEKTGTLFEPSGTIITFPFASCVSIN